MTTYSEILKHPFWQKKRLLVLQRDNFACQNCSDTLSNLQIHHNYYMADTLPWDYPDDALTTLCDLCHLKEEFYKWLHKSGPKLLKDNDNFSVLDINEIIAFVKLKLEKNHHRESATRYMDDIRALIINVKIDA